MTTAKLHARARRGGVQPLVYWLARMFVEPAALLFLRLRRIGMEHVPASGPVIIASNHRSFLDPFVIGLCTRRPVHYVAKQELFANRVVAWWLSALGAFPVARGLSDTEMLATTDAILERGGIVVIFPEGTRVRPGALGRAHRGVGRLALSTGAAVVPVAVIGTEAVRRGWRLRPRRVRIKLGAPLRFEAVPAPSRADAAAATERIWERVMLQWEWLGGLPPLRRAAVVGGGERGAALAALLERGGLAVERGTDARALDPARHDLVVLAGGADELPHDVAALRGPVPHRAGTLVAAPGLVPPLGTDPAAYVAERVGSWAVGTLELPDSLDRGAAVGVVAADRAFARQVADVLRAAGVRPRIAAPRRPLAEAPTA